MGGRRVADGGADALEQARPRQDLGGQRLRPRIVAGQEREPVARMPGRDTRQQVQVIVDDGVGDRLARQIDDARPWQAQQEQQAEHALFVVVGARDLRQHLRVERQAGQDDDGAGRPRIREHVAKDRRQPCLQLSELCHLGGRAPGPERPAHKVVGMSRSALFQ
jgi:hypothetical protein